MPQKRTIQRWEHPTYRYAYVREHRGMACTVIHGSYPKSTGLRWLPSSRTLALKILDDRVREFIYGVRNDAAKEPSATITAIALLDLYLTAKAESIASKTKAQYVYAFETYIPPNIPCSDVAAIREHVRNAASSVSLSASSKSSLLAKCRAVFAFGVDEGYVKANPITKAMVPRVDAPEPLPYKRSDFVKARKAVTSERVGSFLDFLAATGCRTIEALRLTWDMVHGDHVVIDGKRKHHDKAQLRIVPFNLAPDVKRILSSIERTGSSVFGYSSQRHIARMWQGACESVGVEPIGLHAIRKMVVNERLREGWSERLMDAVLGHSTRISKKHYRTPYSVADLLAMSKPVQASRKHDAPKVAKRSTKKQAARRTKPR